MPEAKYFDNDRLPFLDEDKNGIIELPYVYVEDPIRNVQYHGLMLKGVANQLKKWPNDLFGSFMAACLVISGFLLLVVITAIFCSPITNDNNCCEFKISTDKCSFNVYFVKEAMQVWSGKEFCYIETAAREQPDLNIYLINLMRASDTPNSSEVYLKMALASQNANIHIAELSINEFFSKTELSSIAENLNNELLLMAARAYLLWNFPGIAMHPSAYCNLSNIYKSRWNSKIEKRDCIPDKLITMDPMIDLQATDVQCQAFLGFLLREISKNATQIYSLKDALDRFCPRIDNCPEVRVLDLKSRCSVNAFDCPTTYQSGKFWELAI